MGQISMRNNLKFFLIVITEWISGNSDNFYKWSLQGEIRDFLRFTPWKIAFYVLVMDGVTNNVIKTWTAKWHLSF